jgi:hypothetical protein
MTLASTIGITFYILLNFVLLHLMAYMISRYLKKNDTINIHYIATYITLTVTK